MSFAEAQNSNKGIVGRQNPCNFDLCRGNKQDPSQPPPPIHKVFPHSQWGGGGAGAQSRSRCQRLTQPRGAIPRRWWASAEHGAIHTILRFLGGPHPLGHEYRHRHKVRAQIAKGRRGDSQKNQEFPSSGGGPPGLQDIGLCQARQRLCSGDPLTDEGLLALCWGITP